MNKTVSLTISLIVFAMLAACQSEPASQPASQSATLEQDKAHASTINHAHEITVYKSPSCGCCKEWVTYLEEEGFKVTAIDHDDVDVIKAKYGLPDPKLKSCHTAIVGNYLVEGHVPANDIERLLREKPANIKGLSAPGMPMMSPGMASRTPKDYAVLSFTESGETAVYSQY